MPNKKKSDTPEEAALKKMPRLAPISSQASASPLPFCELFSGRSASPVSPLPMCDVFGSAPMTKIKIYDVNSGIGYVINY